jgi:hypothetical protein
VRLIFAVGRRIIMCFRNLRLSPAKAKKTATMDGAAAAKQQSAGARGTGAKKQRTK